MFQLQPRLQPCLAGAEAPPYPEVTEQLMREAQRTVLFLPNEKIKIHFIKCKFYGFV